ncbi:MAG TPA: DUF362 domain-containing protein [Polyangia bacterium]|nr:DUF362 domain-containing protein [Polyangia bacterium]
MSAPPSGPHTVAVISRPGVRYVLDPPFDPPNPVYEMVEASFRALGLDRARAGSPEWNPLGDLIAPGDRVVVKPNFVTSKNFHEHLRGEKLACSSTHGSVLRPILDYALRAAGPRGRVRVVDTPVEGCDLEAVVEGLGVAALLSEYRRRGHDVELLDLRHFRVVPHMALDDVRRVGRSWNLGLLLRERLRGDPLGYQIVDLGERSRFHEVERRGTLLRFHRSHQRTPVPHHVGGRHEYSIPRTVLDADVVINIPKMKTHKKSGVTLALKSCIGLSNEKYWLPHYTAGTPGDDGDEYPEVPPWAVRVENQLQRFPLPGDHSLIARAPRLGDGRSQGGLLHGHVMEGSWQGNDTIWRTVLDLNRVLFDADREGRLRDRPQRRYLALVDGIIAGEGEGPLAATPRPAGLLVAGCDPALVDLVCVRAMGLCEHAVPMITQAFVDPPLPGSSPAALSLVMDGPPVASGAGQGPGSRFVPPRTWPRLAEPAVALS